MNNSLIGAIQYNEIKLCGMLCAMYYYYKCLKGQFQLVSYFLKVLKIDVF